MKQKFKILFWLISAVILFLVFGKNTSNYIYTFYFLMFYLPVVILTAWYFDSFLLQKYLLEKKYWRFAQYTLYTFIISLNLLLVLLFVSIMLIGFYDPLGMPQIIVNYRTLPLISYLLVVLYGFLSLAQMLVNMNEQSPILPVKEINLRADRQNFRLNYSDILYIESMSDYVKIHLQEGETISSREKISNLQKQLEPAFLRIHRSYMVNLEYVSSHTKEKVVVKGKELPISRTYKEKVLRTFS